MVNFKTRPGKVVSAFLILVILNNAVSCNYYTYQVDSGPSMVKIDQLKNSPNYLIIHQKEIAFNLYDVKIDEQAQTISGLLRALPPDHLNYLKTKPEPGSANVYKKNSRDKSKNTAAVIDEVHFYVKDLPLREGETITVPLLAIEKIEIYDQDTGATTRSHVFGALGIMAGVLVILTIVVLLTKSSCPFIYVRDGEQYVFAGEIYSGAIFKSIERNDYLMLPPITATNTLEIKVANKLKEKQFINQVGIMEVSHPICTEVLPDRKGDMHLITNPLKITSAKVDDLEITQLLEYHDSTNFTFNLESGDDFFNTIVLTFPKPKASNEGHLVMHTKNSLWGDYLFGEFTKLFGNKYSFWIEKQNKKPSDEAGRWAIDQGLAMKVYVEINNEWKFVDIVDLVGPLAFRDIVVPIDLTEHHAETVNIKISAGFMMWDLDYVALDYSVDSGINVKYIKPSRALTQAGDDVRAALAKTDTHYLTQKITGEEVTLAFPLSAKVKEGMAYDYVLHSHGYYQHIREYEGSPEMATLLSFKLPGRFSRFSKEKYDEMSELLKVTEVSASIKN